VCVGVQCFISCILVKCVQVKGNALTPEGKIFDAYDTVVPPQEDGSAFLTTGLNTLVQTQGVCAGTDPTTESCQCGQVRKRLM
jgi:hypothetical protein